VETLSCCGSRNSTIQVDRLYILSVNGPKEQLLIGPRSGNYSRASGSDTTLVKLRENGRTQLPVHRPQTHALATPRWRVSSMHSNHVISGRKQEP
jgi:hypothetical protein